MTDSNEEKQRMVKRTSRKGCVPYSCIVISARYIQVKEDEENESRSICRNLNAIAPDICKKSTKTGVQLKGNFRARILGNQKEFSIPSFSI